ncbi:MAG: Alkaline phosphatase synthesis sensor protein PhoR [Anaerolineales bacterium]|nr:Alkaline phosphatase synthesis sensor protein PhoR [Anaerolineales bacterium]
MALVLVILGTALYYSLFFTLNAEVNQTVEQAVETVTASARPALMPQIGLVVGFLEFDVFASPPIYVQAVDREGTVRRTSSNLGGETLPHLPDAVAEALDGKTVWRDHHTPEAHLRILTTPLVLGGETIGVLQVGVSLNNVDRALRQLLTILGAGGVVAIVLSAALGFFLADRALSPIDRITQTALEITRTDDLSRRIQQIGPQDEVGRLATTFNEMLERIDRLFRTQKRFIGDVSHELRTPLTVIRGNLDVLRRVDVPVRQPATDVIQKDDQRQQVLQESLAAIEGEAERMARLINDLLLLAQADAGVQLHREPVEIDNLLIDVCRQGQAIAKGIDLQLTVEDRGVVSGDPDRLRQLLLNLVDNAIKYTPEGGQVTLGLARGDGWVRIDVADTGVGIPPAELPHIFDRFYRIDKARSRQGGGTGLGLSIARWIADAHGGHIDVESEVGEGTTFTVWLPEASSTGG